MKIVRQKHQDTKRFSRTKGKLETTKRAHKLLVRRSNKFIYAQILELSSGKTLAGVKAAKASEAGKLIAEKAKELKVEEIVFDRGSKKYHGQIKLLADAARQGGLVF